MQHTMLMQKFISPSAWFELEYPRLWEMEVYEGIPTFFDSFEGKGAIQIFSVKLGDLNEIPIEMQNYSFLTGKTLVEKMLLFLEKQDIASEANEIEHFRQNGALAVAKEYYSENYFYMACMLEKNNIFILSLYNCMDTPDENEALIISQIIKSIEIY